MGFPILVRCRVYIESGQLKCSTSNTLISCIHMWWMGAALSPTSYILLLCRKLIFIYIIVISGKMYLKSKLQRCLYVNFYQSYEDLWTGSTQQGGWVDPCPTPAGSFTAWSVMHETVNRHIHLMLPDLEQRPGTVRSHAVLISLVMQVVPCWLQMAVARTGYLT